jgi:hypothetical protein
MVPKPVMAAEAAIHEFSGKMRSFERAKKEFIRGLRRLSQMVFIANLRKSAKSADNYFSWVFSRTASCLGRNQKGVDTRFRAYDGLFERHRPRLAVS